MARSTATLAGWGRVPVPGHEILSEDLDADSRGAALMRGLGRSYGDSSLPANADDKIVNTRRAARVIAWDPATGRLRAQAGFALADLNALSMPAGWFTPVTPGTKFVTLGGMVASDVHGKNHHRDGCFGGHVTALRMRVASGDVIACGPALEPELFWATVGGMGLTGHILEVEVQLHRIPSPWLWAESTRVDDLGAYLEALTDGAARWPMTVGWIDCVRGGRGLGRGILIAGRWATADEAPARFPKAPRELRFPIDLPSWGVNRATVTAFNTLYYWRHLRRRKTGVQHPDAFFYPLDALLDWNRGYGPRGFTQYQCVLPRAAGTEAVHAFMHLLTRLGGASPLCVIKDCGPEGQGVLSFPLEGMSIAVDMAIKSNTQHIVDELNALVIAAGGRIYLSKDQFTRAADFRRMEPRLDRFLAIRERWDPKHAIRSAQSVRLFGA